jgi:glucose/arabinose dehydrogenase
MSLSRCSALLSLLLFSLAAYAEQLPLQLIKLPPGFHISVFASGVDNARSMAWNGKDTLYVGTRSQGKVYALLDRNGDFRAEQRYVIASGLDLPNGIAYRNGALYVAEKQRILRYDDIDARLANPPKPTVLYDRLPGEAHHGWRYLNIGPDNKLYVSIGAPCNVCDRPDYGIIARMNPDGSHFEVYARGIRNSVGFTWDPATKELWFSDNGRDWLGDDLPPDELNHAPKQGLHFGFPYCHGGYLLDPEYGKGKNCNAYIPPVQRLGAHVAALGVLIYNGRQFPAAYRRQVLIAEHGSWNRSRKSGYRISLVRLRDSKAIGYESFASGWLQGQRAWGRPVDIKQLPDGSVLVSDDYANAIYRISYSPVAK